MCGGGGGELPPIMLYGSFVGTFGNLSVSGCKPTSMTFVPTQYLKHLHHERNSSFRMWKCENYLSSLDQLARIYIDSSYHKQ